MNEDQKDQRLWKIAKRRADFRRSLYTYIVVIGFLWTIWWFTQGRFGIGHSIPWPAWAMLGWGIGIAFQYFRAYEGDGQDLAEKEYEKLLREKQEKK